MPAAAEACRAARCRAFRDEDGRAPAERFGFGRSDWRRFIFITPADCGPATVKAQTTTMKKSTMLELTKSSAPAGGQLALAATWEAKEGEAEAVADILRRMASAVTAEPGTPLFWSHRSTSNDRVFFLYELFADESAFQAHQQTEHFKNLVIGQALPKLARRERVQFMPLQCDP
jgi:quinol monooxygenase YgiN